MRWPFLFLLGTIIHIPNGAQAQVNARTAGLGIRASAWSLPSGEPRLTWVEGEDYTHFDSDGVGVWLSFLSRVTDNLFLEASLGGVVRKVEEVVRFTEKETYVEVLVPALVGLRVQPAPSASASPILPYLAVGTGPYWSGDLLEVEGGGGSELEGEFDLQWGGYLAAGVDVMLSDWVGVNLDLRRHIVDQRGVVDYSGWEYSAGLQFLWGRRW